MEKKILRSVALGKLFSLTNNEIQFLNFSLTNQIIKFLNNFSELQSQVGGSFLPLNAEIAPLPDQLIRSVSGTLAYPVLTSGQMSFGVPNGELKGQVWLEGAFTEVHPKWILVPGLGFGLNGSRLGRGRGFYDRYLSSSRAIKIGTCWSEQIFETIPVESHDCHMDFIITENFCWEVKQQNKF